jgi:hypothetical protein
MRVAETLAGRIGVAAFDLVESMVEEKPEPAIDVGPRRDAPALTGFEVQRFTTRDMQQTQLGGLSLLNASMPQ